MLRKTALPRFPISENASDSGEKTYSLCIHPEAVDEIGRVAHRMRVDFNGYLIADVLGRIAERGQPAWLGELRFDPESDLCAVYCQRRTPLVFLRRRFEKRLADRKKLKLLVWKVTRELDVD